MEKEYALSTGDLPPRPQVIKLFLVLSSDEHKILTANEYQNSTIIFKLKV